MFGYSILFSCGLIIPRKISLSLDSGNAFAVSSIYYGIASLCVLITTSNLKLDTFISMPCMIGICLMSLQHYLSIVGNKKAKTALSIEIINYLRIFITCILAYLILGNLPKMQTFVGCFIVLIAIFLAKLLENNKVKSHT